MEDKELTPINGSLPLNEIENFIWDTAEDYHLWDEDENGPYPAERMLNAMSKWWTEIMKRQQMGAS